MKDDRNDPFKLPSYEIGYGRPPANRQFVKGKSGNPQGRPKKKMQAAKLPSVDPSTRDRFLKSTSHEVPIREGDAVKKIPLTEAILKAESVAALKGNAHAQKNFLDREERYRKEEAADIKESNEFWQNYVATYDKNVSALQKAGGAIPEHWPHPDDIIFEEGADVKFMGGEPATAAQNRKFIIRFRDVLLLQAEMDRRCFLKEYPRQATPVFLSEFFVVIANSRLPKRMQLDDTHLFIRTARIGVLRKPVLQQQLKHDWTELGLRIKANAATPSLISSLIKLGIDVPELLTGPTARSDRRYRAQN
jgi:hypothetical protein